MLRMIEIKKYEEQGYDFSLKAEDGGNLLNSVTFTNEAEIKKIIEDLKNCIDAQNVFERRTNHEGKFLFSLKDSNGKLIGRSELYSSEAGMENGIKNVRKRIASLVLT